jgi:hypothetical protein
MICSAQASKQRRSWSQSICMARLAEGLPQLGMCLPVLPVLQSLLSHSNYIGRLYPVTLLTVSADPVDPAHLISELRQHMTHLRPGWQPTMPHQLHYYIATSRNAPTSSCEDTMRQALEPHYSSPYRILSQREKTLQLLMCWRPITVSQQGQAGLDPQQDRPQKQLQPTSHSNPGHSTTCHAATALH